MLKTTKPNIMTGASRCLRFRLRRRGREFSSSSLCSPCLLLLLLRVDRYALVWCVSYAMRVMHGAVCTVLGARCWAHGAGCTVLGAARCGAVRRGAARCGAVLRGAQCVAHFTTLLSSPPSKLAPRALVLDPVSATRPCGLFRSFARCVAFLRAFFSFR